MAQTPPRVQTTSVLRGAIIVLTLGTALTHISLLFPDLVFILNGLGYLGLLAARYFPQYIPIRWFAAHPTTVRWLLIGYTALTIGLWLAFGLRAPIGYINKLNELALIVLLFIEMRQQPVR
ncbi:MAG: hypothetical protein HC914_17380 [Chloroflexaceae bacterium]|nr:hypothetical protein [Chloroflexaceae bacterium]